jgi:hypothetical protein
MAERPLLIKALSSGKYLICAGKLIGVSDSAETVAVDITINASRADGSNSIRLCR